MREAVEVLAARDDMLLGVATGKSQRGVRMVLGHHGLLDAFRDHQDRRRCALEAASGHGAGSDARSGRLPGDTVVIGDTTYDIEMARAAGARAIGVTWGYHPVAELHAAGAHEVIGDCALLPSSA